MPALFLTFDIEDFISYNSILVLKRILENLKKHDLRAIFFITGHMVEKIRNFPEIVCLLKDHEIGYHSSSHSVHPTIYEFTDVASYGEAYDNSLLRETSHINPLTGEIEGKGGILALREVFSDKRVNMFRAPGHCWTPPHSEALKDLGITNDFSTSFCRSPIHYKGINFYPYPLIGHWHGAQSEYRVLSNSIIRNKLSVMSIHPHLFATRNEWDAIYQASNPRKIVEPTPRNKEEVTSLLSRFQLLLRRISDLQSVSLLEVTPNLRKPDRELSPKEADVEEWYRMSMRWAFKRNCRPKFLYGHFRKFFGLIN